MKKFLAGAAMLLAAATSHAASSLTTDFSDLWYTAGEDGWGVNMIQQEDVIFATIFVYDNTLTPFWYVASDVRYQGNTNGTLRFTGTLYETSGPFFGTTPFSPSSVTIRQVGTFTFTTTQVNTGTLTYTVDGRTVTKNIQRQTWRTQNIAGRYLGSTTGTWSGCSSGNGAYESSGNYFVTQTGNVVKIIETGSNFVCTYDGTLTQNGQMGTVTGTGSCTDGFQQTFVASEVNASLQSLSMRVTATLGGGCLFVGQMGGMRRP